MKSIAAFILVSICLSFSMLWGAEGVPLEKGTSNPAVVLPAIVRQAAFAIRTEMSHKPGPISKTYSMTSDRAWFDLLARLLEKAPYSQKPHCFCISTVSVMLETKDHEPLMTISVHHGTKLRIGISKGARDIHEVGLWDFEVGEAAGKLAQQFIDAKDVFLPLSKPDPSTMPKPQVSIAPSGT